MRHRLLFGNAAFYESAILDIFQKYPPPASGVVITIHEAGKVRGASTVREVWPPGSKSSADIAKFVAHRILQAYTDRSGTVFDGVTIDFDHLA
jgi:hypothetical protein